MVMLEEFNGSLVEMLPSTLHFCVYFSAYASQPAKFYET